MSTIFFVALASELSSDLPASDEPRGVGLDPVPMIEYVGKEPHCAVFVRYHTNGNSCVMNQLDQLYLSESH